MIRLPTILTNEFVRALASAGLIPELETDRHVLLLRSSDRLLIGIPKHGKEVNRTLIKLVLKESGMSEKELRRAVRAQRQRGSSDERIVST